MFVKLYVATSPQIEGVTGAYFVPIGIKSWTSANAKNETMQKKLWQESERWEKYRNRTISESLIYW